MMTKFVYLVILLAIGLSGSYLIKDGLYIAGIEPSATLACWILGSVCFASILYLLYAIKRMGRGRSDVSLVAEPCIGFLVLLLCWQVWRSISISKLGEPGAKNLKFKVVAKSGDVTLRWSAKKLFVLAAEVRRVFIAHAEPGAGSVQILAEHQTAGFLESYLFLKL
jgi:hypothetical protein